MSGWWFGLVWHPGDIHQLRIGSTCVPSRHQTWLARKSAWRWALKWENLGLESNGLLLNPIKTH
jgi:hypothetical protein